MLKHYLKFAYRNIIKYKSHSIVNVLGLAVAVCAVSLILIYILFEINYDNFHKNEDSIYRVSITSSKDGKIEGESPIFVPPIGPAMRDEIPEIENYVRFSTTRVKYINYEERNFYVNNVSYVDSAFFKIFSFDLIYGDEGKALTEPNLVVLSETTAQRIFGKSNAMGETVVVDNNLYKVSGIMKDIPENSHIQFNALISFSTLYQNPNNYMDWNGGNQYLTYVKLHKNTSYATVENKLPDLMWKNINEMLAHIGIKYDAHLQPLSKIHLHYNSYSNTILTNIYIYSIVAILILIIACANFINLTMARSIKRRKEIGIRKVIGANRRLIIKQLLSETLLVSVVALILGVLLARLIFPMYQQLLNTKYTFLNIFDFTHILGLIGIVIIIGLFAGSYPAIYLASTNTIQNLRRIDSKGSVNIKLRNILVAFQFIISLALIISTLFIQSQINFMQNKEVGFEKENIVVVPLLSDEARNKGEIIKNELLKEKDVINSSASSDIPYNSFTMNGYFPEGHDSPMMINVVDVDDDFIDLYNIKVIKGRNFSQEFETDKDAYIINETLAKQLGWDNPVGKIIRRNGEHKVIGVVKDFHFASMHHYLAPLIITNKPYLNRFDDISVKINPADISQTINSFKEIWQRIVPAASFDYYFLDEALGNLYESEIRFKNLFIYFSGLAIIVALLGLFSLTSLSIEQRIKEIGIRKVLGASIFGIINIFIKEVLLIVIASTIIASPVAYYFINSWLQDFAYRINIGFGIFIISSTIVFLLAVIAICYQTIKAAFANPVDSLKYE